MYSPHLAAINAVVRELLSLLEEARKRGGGALREEILRKIDELEDNFDLLVQAASPERITDVRFNAAVKALHEASEKIEELRNLVVSGRFRLASRKVLDVQAAIRHANRLLVLVRAGAPAPLVFRVAPEIVKEATVSPPEELVYASPLASRVYNALVRRGRYPLDELIRDLGIGEEEMGELNRAIHVLTSRGYARLSFTPDGKTVLEAIR